MNGKTYGGGGIFGLYATVRRQPLGAVQLVHEFGHHIAGLADEFLTSDVSYLPVQARLEPWEPNVTALLDPGACEMGVRWPPPMCRCRRPWDKAAYEAALEGDPGAASCRSARPTGQRRRWTRCSRRSGRRDTALLLARGVLVSASGWAFEGADYEAPGYYRPQVDCIMFTRDDVPFCRVCQWAIGRVIICTREASGLRTADCALRATGYGNGPQTMARKYWLMKCEPSAYTIEQLERDGSCGWEGAWPELSARNFMRDEMQVGDGVLFYASSADPSGVAQELEILKAGYPDPFAFQKGHHYFDADSKKDAPTWYTVDLKFVERFKGTVPLSN